jgi:hypothetical protein
MKGAALPLSEQRAIPLDQRDAEDGTFVEEECREASTPARQRKT